MADKARMLRAPDGFVYQWTDALSKIPGFVEVGTAAAIAPAAEPAVKRVVDLTATQTFQPLAGWPVAAPAAADEAMQTPAPDQPVPPAPETAGAPVEEPAGESKPARRTRKAKPE